ncbi:MAG: glycosyltransferase [Verrucomicrobiota bacterium JB024]|nr:glycosyltransferase [Verrucomicrobiota bacterium JB024]
MKILHVIHTMRPEAGGVVEAVRLIAAAQIELGHHAEVLCLDAAGTNYRPLPFHVYEVGPAKGTYGYCTHLKPWLRMHAGEFDAVIVHGLWQYIGLAVHNALRHTGRPYYVFPHGMLDPWFNQAYPRKRLKKRLYWHLAEYRVLRDARAVCFTCEAERELARVSFSPYRVKAEVVGLGIEEPVGDIAAAQAAFKERFPEIRDNFLLYLGRIDPKKGLDLLVLAYDELVSNGGRPPPLVLAGPGETSVYADRLRTLSDANDIHFTGMLSGELKWGALARSQALILPSHQENFGIVVAEALAMGKPVLISDKVNIWREIAEDAAGLVEADTLAGTEQLLYRWLSLSQGEKHVMAQAARPCYQRRFSIPEVARRLMDVIDQPE